MNTCSLMTRSMSRQFVVILRTILRTKIFVSEVKDGRTHFLTSGKASCQLSIVHSKLHAENLTLTLN